MTLPLSNQHRWTRPVLVALASALLIVAACGGAETASQGAEQASPPASAAPPSTELAPDDAGSPTTQAGSTTSSAPTTAGTVATTTTTAVTTTEALPPEPEVDGPVVPAFEMALASGETFSIVDEVQPVYLVFWAEW